MISRGGGTVECPTRLLFQTKGVGVDRYLRFRPLL